MRWRPTSTPGTVVPYHDAEAAAREMNSLNFLEAADQHVRGAAQFLLRSSPKVAVSGFCMGGAVAILAASRSPEFSAVVPFYGLPPETVAKPADVKVPLQGHFANSDDYITPEKVDAFEKGLKAAGKTAEIYRYDASHAFMNEQRSVHDRHCAELAWERGQRVFEDVSGLRAGLPQQRHADGGRHPGNDPRVVC